jgi:hypothetical protein
MDAARRSDPRDRRVLPDTGGEERPERRGDRDRPLAPEVEKIWNSPR